MPTSYRPSILTEWSPELNRYFRRSGPSGSLASYRMRGRRRGRGKGRGMGREGREQPPPSRAAGSSPASSHARMSLSRDPAILGSSWGHLGVILGSSSGRPCTFRTAPRGRPPGFITRAGGYREFEIEDSHAHDIYIYISSSHLPKSSPPYGGEDMSISRFALCAPRVLLLMCRCD